MLQLAEITGSDPINYSGIGYGVSTAINSSGNIIAIGGLYSDQVIPYSLMPVPNADKKVYIFTGDGTNWIESAKINDTGLYSNSQFGRTISLNSSGNVLAVGAYKAFITGGINFTAAGRVSIFTSSGNLWNSGVTITGNPSQAYGYFGMSLALNDQGNTLFVGAPTMTFNNYQYIGGVYVFTGSGANWNQIKIITGTTISNSYFGRSISINSSGDVVAIGAPQIGRVYIFTGNNYNWSQAALLTGSISGGRSFGTDVKLNKAGNTLFVYKISDTGNTLIDEYSNSAVYVFTGNGNNWVETKRIKRDYQHYYPSDYFGRSISVNDNTDVLALGAVGPDYNGAVYIYTKNGNDWIESGKIIQNTTNINLGGFSWDEFGVSTSLNSSGNILVVGAPGKDKSSSLQDAGSAYIYSLLLNSSSSSSSSSTIGCFTGIAAGTYYSYLITKDGTPTGLGGANFYGERRTPNSAINNVEKIAIGEYHTLAKLKDGRITGWGNLTGFSYLGPIDYQQTFININNLGKNITKLAVGANHNAVLFSDNTFTGWGIVNGPDYFGPVSGQIPQTIQGNVLDIACGKEHAIALLKNGSITGWGDPIWKTGLSPSIVGNVTGNLTAGNSISWAILKTNGITGWGKVNGYHRLTGYASNSIQKISAGNNHIIALLSGGVVTGEGYDIIEGVNNYGQLNIPNSVSGNAVDIEAKEHYSLALLKDGTVVGWGNNLNRQINIPLCLSGELIQVSILNIVAPSGQIAGREPIPGCEPPGFNFEFILKGEKDFDPLYKSKHKFLIYKSGQNNNYLPIFETDYTPYSQDAILTCVGTLDTGNYKTQIRTIYNNNFKTPSFCNSGVQVANLIDYTYSNKSGLALFKSNSSILLDSFIKTNSGLNQVANIFFHKDPFNFINNDFTNNSQSLFNSIKFIEPYEKEKEGVSLSDAIDQAMRLSWNRNKVKIINIITNNSPYIESDIDACYASLSQFSAPSIEVKYSGLLEKIANYRDSEDVSFNFIYIDKNLNYPINKSKFIYNEITLKKFYEKAAQIGNGFFGDNDISIIGNSALNASYLVSKLPMCGNISYSSSSSSFCCPSPPTCGTGQYLIISGLKYIDNCGFCSDYICSSSSSSGPVCGTIPIGVQENDIVDVSVSFVTYNKKDRLAVWLSGCNHQFNCNVSGFNGSDNFINQIQMSGLLLFDTTCIDTNNDSAPNSIPYNWQKYSNAITATTSFVFKSGMMPFGKILISNCETPFSGTRWVAAITARVSGSVIYTKNFDGKDEGYCEYGNITSSQFLPYFNFKNYLNNYINV